jgi:lipid II isoglutaminyl synthase (glutamine-hydrolysing)
MIIEVMYPRVAQLFGDQGNIDYLKRCLPQAHFRYCDLNSTPYFAHHSVDMIIIGPSSERVQRLMIEHLLPYRERILSLIEQGVIFLITGTSFDIFGQHIQSDEGQKHSALNLFEFTVVQDRLKRFNSFMLGQHKGMELVGFKSQFTRVYPKSDLPAMMKMVRGEGYYPQALYEGIHRNNFYATQMLGPILILNPFFTIQLLKLLGLKNVKLPFHEALIHAYQKRLQEFNNPAMIDYP